MNEIKEYHLKITVIGDIAVGKTSLIEKFVSDKFSNDYRASIGINLYMTSVHLDTGLARVQLWDIAGHAKWQTAVKTYYVGSKGALIVLDVTRKETLERIENYWNSEFKKYCPASPVILIANKTDLERVVSIKDVEAVGKRIDALSIISTSAKTGENVRDAFKIMAELAVEHAK